MQIDATTAEDLNLFGGSEEMSVFSLLDHTLTMKGADWLHIYLETPHRNIRDIVETQNLLKEIVLKEHQWPKNVNNGTVMVAGRFCETSFEGLPSSFSFFETFIYKYYHKFDFSLIKYSVDHLSIFIKDIGAICNLLSPGAISQALVTILDKVTGLINERDVFKIIIDWPAGQRKKDADYLRLGYFLSASVQAIQKLLDLYGRLDAYYSMAVSVNKYKYIFPEFIKAEFPFVKAVDLYHPLVTNAMSASIDISEGNNVVFITGANMSGKSTFIRALGVSVYLAHVGMAIPASSMQMSFFSGLITNIQLSDDISKGESYFYNEVQRVKRTIGKISDSRPWLVLIDELFKGTNVEDSRKCSIAVIKGLAKLKNINCLLSSHLYEIAEDLAEVPNIQFKFFETQIKGSSLSFSYQLREGVSDDRIGYLIMENNGVVGLLENL